MEMSLSRFCLFKELADSLSDLGREVFEFGEVDVCVFGIEVLGSSFKCVDGILKSEEEVDGGNGVFVDGEKLAGRDLLDGLVHGIEEAVEGAGP